MRSLCGLFAFRFCRILNCSCFRFGFGFESSLVTLFTVLYCTVLGSGRTTIHAACGHWMQVTEAWASVCTIGRRAATRLVGSSFNCQLVGRSVSPSVSQSFNQSRRKIKEEGERERERRHFGKHGRAEAAAQATALDLAREGQNEGCSAELPSIQPQPQHAAATVTEQPSSQPGTRRRKRDEFASPKHRKRPEPHTRRKKLDLPRNALYSTVEEQKQPTIEKKKEKEKGEEGEECSRHESKRTKEGKSRDGGEAGESAGQGFTR